METKTKKWVVAVLFAVLFACVALLSLGVTAFTSTRARAATGDTITSISIAPESDTTRFYNFETLGELKTESEIGGEAVGPRLIVTATYDNNSSLTERLAASAFTLTTEGGLKETDTLPAGQHTVIATLVGNAEISDRCTIEVRDNEIVSISATYDAERAGEISPTTQLGFLRRYIAIAGKYANGDPASNISNWSIEGDLAAPRDNTSETYSKVVKIVYNDDAYVKPYELTITNIKAQDPTGIFLATSSEVSYGAGTKFDPSEAAFDFTIMYSTGVITLRYSASDTRFSFSYTNEEGEAICDADGNVRPGMEAYADKDAFEYYITTNNTDYLYIYYTENGETVEYQIIVNVFKSAHSIVILNSDGTTYRPGQTTSGLTYEYEVTSDNAATGKAHSFDLDNTGYEFDPEIMEIKVSGNREGGEAINSGIEIVEAASKQTGEVRLTEAGTYTVIVALTNPGYYWSTYEESDSLSFTVIIEKADLEDLSVSVGHTTCDDSEVQQPGWTYGETFREEWVTYAGNYGGGDVTWHYSGRLNAGTDYSDNAQAPTDAGAYKVYVDISETDNFKAGSTKGAPAEFIVGKLEIEPTLTDSEHNILQTKTYAGTPLTADAVADGRYSILTNAQNAQNVGTYSVTLRLTDIYNYRWDTPAGSVGSDTFANRAVLFEIVAQQVDRPQSAFTNTYDGNEQTIDLNLGGTIGEGSTDAFQAPVKGTATRHSGIGDTTPVLDWSISGDTVSATSAAVYKVTVKLNNTVLNGDGDGVYINYVWANDQSHGDIVVTWTIEKAHNPISVTMDDWTYGQTAQDPSATATFNQEGAKYEFYKDEACSTPAVGDDASQKPTAAGTYWVKATIAATGDYGDESQGFAASVAKDSFTIVQATLALPEIAGDEAYYTYSGGRIDVKINASYLNGGNDVAITRADQFSEYFTFSGNLNGTDAGDYVLTVTLNSNYKWTAVPEGGSLDTDNLKLSWSIEQQEIALPEIYGTYSYTGNAQNVQISAMYLNEGSPFTPANETSVYFTFDGNITETDAGSDYTLIIKLSSNYKWTGIPNGGSSVTDNLSLSWSIAQAIPVIDSFTIEGWEYDSAAQSPGISVNFDGEEFNIDYSIDYVYYFDADQDGSFAENEIVEAPTNKSSAGSYKVVAKVAADESGNWIESAAKEATFTISRKKISTPEVDYSAGAGTVGGTQGYTYADGKTIFVVIQSDELGSVKVEGTQSLEPYFTFSPNNSGENAGGYTLSVTPTANYAWEDGTFEAKDIGWNIVARVIELPTFDGGTEKESGYSRGEQSAEIVTYDEKAMSVAVSADNSANESGRFDQGTGTVYATHADVYTVTVTLNNPEGITNYTWAEGTDTAEKTLSWTISPEVIYAPSFAGAAEDGKLTTEFKDTLSDATRSWVATPEEQTAAVNGYDDGAMSFVVSGEGSYSAGGSVVATNAGVYTVTVTLKNSADIQNFVWAEGVGSDGTVTLTWEITPKAVGINVATTAEDRAVTYQSDAPSQTITAIEDYVTSGQGSAYFVFNENKYYQYQGGSYAVCSEPQGYGDYYFYIDLKDKDTKNYKWSDASVSGGEAHLNDSLIDGSGVTKRFWFQIAKADYTVEVTFEGGAESYIYGTVPSVKYNIPDEEAEEVKNAIKEGKITVSYYYLGIDGTDYGADQNDGVGSTVIPQNVGKYRVVVYIPEVEGGNYRAMRVGLGNEYKFEITPKKLTVTFTGDAFNDGYSFAYGTAADASVSVDGYEYSDDREETSRVTLAYFKGEESLGSSFPKNVGNYTVVASVGDLNYYIEDGSAGKKLRSTSADYIVTPAKLSVTVEGQNITYGEARGEWVLSATGWVTVYGDEQAQYEAAFLKAVKAAISCDYEQGWNVGDYPITLNAPANIGDWAKNYNITYESGKQVSVSPRKLTVVITGGQDSYTYGDVIAHGYEFVNLYNSDEVTVTLTYTGTGDYNNTSAPKNVGSYSVTASISGNENYVPDTENTKSVQFTIGQRKLTIVIADKTTIYGEAAPDWTIERYTNIGTGDEELLKGLVEIQENFSCAYVAGKSGVSTYPVTLTEKALAAIEAGAGNYKITVDEGSLTVSPRQITVEIADKTSIYGGEIVELTASVDTSGGKYGLVGDDPDPWTLSAENISETSDAGTYTISGTATDGNYEVVQFNTGTYTITPRQVEIQFALPYDEGAETITYSGTEKEVTAEVSGTVNGDVITAEVTYNTDDKSAPVNVNADGYTATATLSGKKANNYYVTSTGSGTAEDEYVYLRYAEQDFTIAKANLTVETYETDGTVVYGDVAVFGYEITGFVNDETESVLEGKIGYTTNYEPGAESGAAGGAYAVSYKEGSFTSGNYEISAAEKNSFQVTAREVTLDLGSLIADFVYGKAAGASARIKETLPDSIEGEDLEFSYTYAGRDGTVYDDTEEYPTFAGKYTVTVTIGNLNYELTGANSKDYEITQKTVRVKADDKTITYGNVPDYTISYTQADFVYGETAETAGIDESGLAFNCSYRQGDDATTYSITASGLTSRNYAFTYEEGTLTVGKREITVILIDAESTYGDTRDLYDQARVTGLYTGGTGGENTEDTAKEVYGFTVYRYDAETTEYLPFDRDFGSAETGAGTYYFVLVNNMPNNYVITVEGGYTVKDEEAGRHVIDPKSLQVDIIGNNSVTYDGNSHAITAKIKTEEGVDDVSMLSHYTGKDGTDYDSDTAPTNAGSYTVTFRSSDPNYTSAEISATLTISPRTIDIVWNGGETETYTYDNKPKTVTAAYHPYVNGEMDEGQSIALTAEVTSYEAYTLQGGFAAAVSGARAFKDAGSYTFTVSFAENDSNYVLPAVNTRAFTIERAEITVYIADKTSEYGDDLAALTYRIEGDIYDAAETVFTLSTDATPSSNVGSDYEISGSVNEARGLNYIVAFYRESSGRNMAVYTIAPRALVVSATYNTNNTIVYGDAVDEDLFSLSYKRANDKSGDPFVNEGDEEKINFSSGLYDYSRYAGGLNGTKAGTPIDVTIDTTRMSLANYSFSFEGEASFTVIKRDISVNGSFKENLPAKYTSYALEAVMSADYIDGKIGDEVLGEHFGFTLTYFIQEEGEYKPVSGEIVNAGTYYITVALNNADTSSYELADADYIEWKIEKAELNISLDGDLSADGVQNVVVRYGNALDDSELFGYLVIEGLLGDDAQTYREDVVGNLKATHDYSVADKNNPTAAGTRLPVTLAFEKELPNYVFANVGDDSHGTIEVAKRRINLSMNTYDDDGEVYGMYNGGQFEKPEGFWDISAAEADVVGVSEYQGLVGDDKVGTDVTFTYIYYGTSYDGVWLHALEEGITQNPTLAGKYTVRVTIESDNYIIYGGSPAHGGVEYVDLTYRILKQRVEAPAFVGDGIDNGNAQATGDAYMASVEFNSNVIGVVSKSWQATNGGEIISASMQGENMFIMTASAAGGYSVRLELKDPDNYVWEGDTGSEVNTPYWTIEWRITIYRDVSIEITGITVNEVPYALKDDLFGGETVKWFDVEEGWVYGVSFAAEDIGVQVTFEGGDGVYAGAIEYQFQRWVSGGWDSASSSFLGAGTYRVHAIVADPNYERKESAWVYYTIDKQTVAVPTVENGVYNHGAAVTSKLVGFDNALMSEGLACEHVTLVYSGGAWYLQANVVSANHFIQIALTDPSNYCWLQDGETLSKTSVQVNWTIERYKVKAPTGYSEDFSAEYNGSIITFEYTDSEDRAYYRVSGASGTNAGSYTFTVSLVNTNNYEWEDKTTGSITVGWNIAKAANSWLDDEYSRAGWTYGGAPTAEKLPSAKFGNIAVAYYTDADCTIPIDFGAFTNGTPAGTYYVVVKVADSTNYTSPEPIKGEFTVGKAPVTVIWDGAEGLVYNGQIQAAPTASYNALLGQGSSIELIVTPSFEGEFKNAGSSYTFTAAFKESDGYAANYYIASGGSTVRAIAAAEVHVEVLPQSAVYTGGKPDVLQEENQAYRISSGDTYSDFNLTFSIPEDAVDAGTYVIDAVCSSTNYAVTFTGSALFTITPKDISISITAGGGTYGSVTYATATASDENAQNSLSLTYAGTPNGGKFTEFGPGEKPTEAGSYIVTATVSDRNYNVTGTNTAAFIIAKARVTVQPISDKPYNGNLQKAEPVVSCSVEEDGIYTVIDEGGTDVGNYAVRFEFGENKENNFVWFYNGSEVNGATMTLNFAITIVKAENNPVTLEKPVGWTYGNKAETLEANAAFGTPVLYYATGENGAYGTNVPVHAGTYWVKAVVSATTNYEGSESAAYEFTISALELETPEFADAETVYNGGAQTNAFTGYDRGMMTISSNSGALVTTDGFALRAMNAGEYYITFALSYSGGGQEGDYVWKDASGSETVTIKWTIRQAVNDWDGVYERDGWTYGQAASEEKIPGADFGTVVVEYFTDSALQNEYTGVFDGSTAAGTYYVRITVEGNTNYTGLSLGADGSLFFTVEVAQNGWKDDQNAYERDGWTYGDEATEETLPVPEFGSASVAYYTDSAHTKPYTGSFDSRTNAGIYYVVITVEGSENYSGITLNGQFEVEKRSLALPALADTADTAVETGDTLHNEIVGFDSSTMNMSELGSGITTIDGKLYLAAKDAGVYQITISLADTSNYQWTDGKDGDVTLVWTLRRAELESWTEESESRYPDVIVSADGGIHPLYTLEISSILEESYGDYDLSAYENAEIALGYDIGFTSGGEAVQPESAVTVRLKVTDEIASALGEGYTLLHLHGGEWSEVSYTVEDGYAVFTVTEFSAFLFITETPATSLVWLIIVLAVLLTVEIVLLVVAIVKRRKGRN